MGISYNSKLSLLVLRWQKLWNEKFVRSWHALLHDLRGQTVKIALARPSGFWTLVERRFLAGTGQHLSIFTNLINNLTHSLERVWELRALEGGDRICPLLSKLSIGLETYKNSLRWKFGDPRSIFSWSNDVIIAKFPHFPVKSAGLQLSRSGAQIWQIATSDKRE